MLHRVYHGDGYLLCYQTKKPEYKKRKCLKCDCVFNSEAGNRLCGSCRAFANDNKEADSINEMIVSVKPGSNLLNY